MTETQLIPEPKDVVKPCRPTPPERAALATHHGRLRDHPSAPRLHMSMRDGVAAVGVEHSNPAIGEPS